MSPLFALLQVVEPAPAVTGGITTYALLFMLISMGAVTLLAAWCFWRILSTKQHFDPDGTGPMHAPVPGEAEGGPPRG